MAYLANSQTNANGLNYDALLFCKTNIGGYFFDGFISSEHQRNLTITENPVETGASIVDHAYLQPSTLTMEIVMSDVHRSLINGQFSDSKSRSVSAWNILVSLQKNRIPVSVLTRLGLYENMLISSLYTQDTASTFNGLRVTVTLREIPIARVKTVKISAADQTTIDTQMAKVETQSMAEEAMTLLMTLMGGNL